MRPHSLFGSNVMYEGSGDPEAPVCDRTAACACTTGFDGGEVGGKGSIAKIEVSRGGYGIPETLGRGDEHISIIVMSPSDIAAVEKANE